MRKNKYIVLMAMLFLFLAGCSSISSADDISSLQNQVKDKIGAQQVLIPTYKKYPMLSAVIVNEQVNNHKVLKLTYGTKKDALEDKDATKKMEKDTNAEVLYGPYKGAGVLNVTYDKNQVHLGDADAKSLKSNGTDVSYEKVNQNGINLMTAVVNSDNGSYTFDFFLNKDFSDKNAFNIIDQFTKKLSNK